MPIETFEITHKIVEQLEELKQQVPEVINHFLSLSALALKTGAIEGRIKSLIALAIAITQNSAECIAFHLQNLIKQKLTYEELMEVIAVATYMGGGIALAASTHALELFQKLNQNNTDRVDTHTHNTFESTKGYEG